jgi:hypothetical protein
MHSITVRAYYARTVMHSIALEGLVRVRTTPLIPWIPDQLSAVSGGSLLWNHVMIDVIHEKQ